MHQPPFQLAIETSSPVGSVSLANAQGIIETVVLPQQRRHAMELMPTIDALTQKHNINRHDIASVYVSHGPGSFTGLRISVTTAKTLGYVLGCTLVAVPTLQTIVRNVKPTPQLQYAAIMLNAKRGQCFTGLFKANQSHWEPLTDPTLMTPQQVDNALDSPFILVGDHLPDYNWSNRANKVDNTLATPKSQTVWEIGRQMESQNQTTTPVHLNPLYVRLPEAEEVWQAKQQQQQQQQ